MKRDRSLIGLRFLVSMLLPSPTLATSQAQSGRRIDFAQRAVFHPRLIFESELKRNGEMLIISSSRCVWILFSSPYKIATQCTDPHNVRADMEEYEARSAASILASVKEQEARFEQLTRALEEERRHVSLQLERANMPRNDHLPWQQVVMQARKFFSCGYKERTVS
ncbi:hypothetical protein KOW79_018370 [Hemibagrus wyckioides]|uniref:Uncharacterized protein n=1 Tax=Hemibagrus wyckioides TaxID=337641 RepID=A0A9D3NCN8_9TELE|nr:hypothetical protein KOW79_018370 [Hemibagrus wyckioides]